jgi:hypothetical protein
MIDINIHIIKLLFVVSATPELIKNSPKDNLTVPKLSSNKNGNAECSH